MKARFKFPLLLVIVAIPFNFIFSQELKEKKFQSVLLINGHAASSTIGFGGKYSGSYSLSKFPDYALGINLSCEKITGFIKFLIPKNVGTEITLGTLGCHARYKINSQLIIQPEFSVLIGRQETTKILSRSTIQYQPGFQIITTSYYEKNNQQNIIGGHFEQHLFFYPKKAKPVVLGLSVFERFLNAEYYESDIGICVYLGIKI